MNKYLIEHKIKTIADLYDPFEYKNFHFRSWDFNFAEGCIGDAWIAKKVVSAKNATEAINLFRRELFFLIGKLSFISQCYFDAKLESYLIFKQNNNPKKILFLYITRERDGVSLNFGKDEIVALKKLNKFKKQSVFKYLNESTNATTYYTRLAMLIIVLESIAGDKKQEEICKCGQDRKFITTDKEKIKEILNDEKLYKSIFDYKDGIRNKIFHGKEINKSDNYVEKVYEKIIFYFNKKYNIKINTSVVGPQRNFIGNYETGRFWLQLKEEIEKINIKDMAIVTEKAYGNYNHNNKDDFNKIFIHTKMPKNY